MTRVVGRRGAAGGSNLNPAGLARALVFLLPTPPPFPFILSTYPISHHRPPPPPPPPRFVSFHGSSLSVQHYPKEQLYVIQSENLFYHTGAEMDMLTTWLGLRSHLPHERANFVPIGSTHMKRFNQQYLTRNVGQKKANFAQRFDCSKQHMNSFCKHGLAKRGCAYARVYAWEHQCGGQAGKGGQGKGGSWKT